MTQEQAQKRLDAALMERFEDGVFFARGVSDDRWWFRHENGDSRYRKTFNVSLHVGGLMIYSRSDDDLELLVNDAIGTIRKWRAPTHIEEQEVQSC